MKQARLADGTTLQFPDETPDDVMDRAVQEHIAASRTPQETRLAEGRAINNSTTGMVGSLARQLGQGVTFGHYDELQAGLEGGINYLTGGRVGQPYARALESGRARDAATQADQPMASFALNMAGGLAVPLPGAAPAAAGASLGQRLLRSVPARSAAAGGAAGALQGVGDAESWAAAPGGALGGAAIGGALGGAFGGGIALGAPLMRRVGAALGLGNPDIRAERLAIRALDRDGSTPAQAAERLLNPPEGAPFALVDAGGRSTVGLGATAANTPSEAAEIADRFVQARRGGRPERVATLVDATLGGGGGTRVLDDVDALRGLQRAAGAQFDKAFQRRLPHTTTERLQPFVRDGIGQDALQRGLRILEVEHLTDPATRGQPLDLAALGVSRGQDGGLVLDGRMQNLRLWHAVKMGYDDIVREALNDPTKRQTQYERAVNGARAALVQELRGTVPAYAKALDAWGDPQAAIDAMRTGQAALRLNPDVVDQRVGAMRGPAEMEAARVGLGRAITDATDDPGTAVGAARRLAEDRGNQRRIQSLQPDSAISARLLRGLSNEAQMGNVEQAVSPRAGSHTARLLAGGEDMQNSPHGPLVSALLSGSAGPMLAWMGRAGQGINNETSDALARIMFQNDPAGAKAAVERLISREGSDAQRKAMMAELLRRGTQGVATGVVAANDR